MESDRPTLRGLHAGSSNPQCRPMPQATLSPTALRHWIGPIVGFVIVVILAVSALGAFPSSAQGSMPTATPSPTPTTAPVSSEEESLNPVQAAADAMDSGFADLPISTAPERQVAPVVAYNKNADEYMVIWTDDRSSPGRFDIYGQVVSAEGTLSGSEFIVAQDISADWNTDIAPRLAHNSNDNQYLVVWHENDHTHPDESIYSQLLSSSGERIGGMQTITSYTALRAVKDVAYNSTSNEYLVIWVDRQTWPRCIHGRRVTSQGVPTGSETVLSEGMSTTISMVYNKDSNEYLLVYCHWLGGTISDEMRAQRISGTDLSMLGGEIYLTADVPGGQWIPVVSHSTDTNEYLVVWVDHRNGDSDVYAQLVTAGGTLIGGNFPVVVAADEQTAPAVAYNTISHSYLVMWEDHRDAGISRIRALSVEWDGWIGDELVVSEASDWQRYPYVASGDRDTKLLAVWDDRRDTSEDIYGSLLFQDVSFRVESVTVFDSDGNELPWDALVTGGVILEARGTGDHPPTSVEARTTSLQSGRVETIPLQYDSTVDGTHIYGIKASGFVDPFDDLTVAAVVYEEEVFDYEVAEDFMEKLGVPEERRLGIAWGDGDEAQNRPPATMDYMRAAGYETVRVEMVDYPSASSDEFFAQNQADVLFYLGHGRHDDNYLYLEGIYSQARPEDIGDAWNDVETVVFFGCSVLDINDMNDWWGNKNSPGKKWIDEVPGPEVWLGFQHYAPVVGDPDEQGEEAAYGLAEEYAGGEGWVDAWRNATRFSLERPRFVGAVAIDLDPEECSYYYWKEFCGTILGKKVCLYTWEPVPCEDWDSSSLGLQGFMASPAEVHIYDQQGRHVGPNADGGVDTEIPGSAYWTPIVAGEETGDARRISIPTADLSQDYQLRLVGTGEGVIHFFLEIPDRSTGTLYRTAYISVPVTTGAEFALALEPGTDFALALDADGDGVFEGQVAPSELVSRALDLPVNLTLSGTAGRNGWYTSDVAATLSASTRPDLPPVVGLEYDLGAGWQSYQIPLVFTLEGTHTLRYRGVFTGTNYDVAQEVNIRVDETPPVVTIIEPAVLTYTSNSTFTVAYEAWDTISGLEAVTATLDGERVTNGQIVEVMFLAPGSHEIAVTARDLAGWETTQTRTIQVEEAVSDLICPSLTGPVTYVDSGYAPTCPGVSSEPGQLKLVDSQCNPIADARVNLRKANGGYITYKKTGADGVVDFNDHDGSAVPSLFEVDYHGGKYATAAGSYDTGAVVQTREYHLQFIGSDCAPIENARVNLRKANDGYVTYVKTDADGIAAFQVVPDAQMKLEVDYHGAKWLSEANTANVDIVLGTEAFRLRLIDSGGSPIENARVNLRKANDVYVTYAKTDGNGWASFDVVSDGDLKLEVDYHGARYATSPSTSHTPETVQTKAFSLRLIDSTGQPIENARMNLRKSNDAYVTYARTDVDGIASFEVVPGAQMKLEIDYRGAKYATPVTTITEDTQLEVQTQGLAMKVTDSTGQPLADARVNLRNATGSYVTYTKTDADGIAFFDVVPGAEMRLELDYHGATYMTDPVVVNGYVEVPVQTKSFSLRLIDSTGQPVENARVNLRKSNGAYVTYAKTDTDGVASLEVVPGAQMKLEVDHHGAKYATPVTTVTDNTQLEVQTMAFSLRLIDSTGQPIENARVNLRKANDAYVTYTKTGSDGIASFEVVPGAQMKLEIDYHGGKHATGVTTVDADTQLDVQTVALMVHVTANDVDLVNQRVDLLKADSGYVAYARTGTDGRVIFEVLPGAQHKVRCTYDGNTWISDVIIGPAEVSYDFA
jgi:protocatechuate 3,4-dioxygenase beta subunit